MSLPFRYFAAAVVFHIGAWLALFADAQAATRFAGGLGMPLASLHLATLGVLTMTAIGASLQLLPVATRRPVASERAPAAIFVVIVPAIAALASLVVTLASGAALALSYTVALPIDRGTAIALHIVFAAYGFMGMLAMGVSYILLPM